jgi:uncharacterized RDD family membrane protein YckC
MDPRIEGESSAPHGRRALAWLTDLAIVGVMALLFTSLLQLPGLISLVLGGRLPHVSPKWFLPFAVLFFIAYQTSCMWLTQRTAGKAMFGLRVRRAGERSGFLWALGRSTVGYIVIDVFGAGTVLAFGNRRHRCLHDFVFGSEVVLEQAGALRPRVLWNRLLEFEEERQASRDEKTKSLRLLKSFVKFLIGLGSPLTAALGPSRKPRAPAPVSVAASPLPSAVIAPVSTLSVHATVAIVAATSAITIAVAASPPVRHGAVAFFRPGASPTVSPRMLSIAELAPAGQSASPVPSTESPSQSQANQPSRRFIPVDPMLHSSQPPAGTISSQPPPQTNQSPSGTSPSQPPPQTYRSLSQPSLTPSSSSSSSSTPTPTTATPTPTGGTGASTNDVSSSWSGSPPTINGQINAGEWAGAGVMQIPQGTMLVKNDSQFLYLALDLTETTVSNPSDYFWFSVDVDQNAAITPNVDINYGQWPNEPNHLGRQYYLGPGQWTGLVAETSTSMCFQGFGTSPASGSNHRTWTMRLARSEMGVSGSTSTTVPFGIRIGSTSPSAASDSPINFDTDFSHLKRIFLSRQPVG